METLNIEVVLGAMKAFAQACEEHAAHVWEMRGADKNLDKQMRFYWDFYSYLFKAYVLKTYIKLY